MSSLPFSAKSTIKRSSVIGIAYSNQALLKSYAGECRLAVTTVAGRRLALFNGKGNSLFVHNAKNTGGGLYHTCAQTKRGIVSRKFIVNRYDGPHTIEWLSSRSVRYLGFLFAHRDDCLLSCNRTG
jgi:anthranilate/para-aminobenzoate synthase component II